MKFINNFKLLLIFGACIFVLKPLDAKAYTYHTQAEAVKWANDQVGKGIDYDGIYGNQCVDLIKAYYKYLAGVETYGNGSDYKTNALPAGWTRVYSNFQPGDVAVWKTNHVGIIDSADEVGFNAVNQNYNEPVDGAGVCKMVWFYNSVLECAIRPDFSNDNEAPTITNVKVSDITKDGYTIKLNVSDNVGVTSVKYPSWNTDKHSGNDAVWLDGNAVSNGSTWCRVDLSKLKSGAVEGNYITHIYAYDAAGNQTCVATPIVNIDRTNPIIEDAKVIKVDSDGYTIQCKATDNVKIAKVQCPTWTQANDQDDIAKDWGTNKAVKATHKGEGVYEFTVKRSDHNNEFGLYNTHIYAYDSCGNYTVAALNSIEVSEAPVLDEGGWYHCSVLPDNINGDSYDIEYNNHYEKIQEQSPGEGWSQAEKVKDEWVNVGEPFTSENDLDTSDGFLILTRSIYYHFCGKDAGRSGNYAQVGNFNHYDEIDTSKYSVSVASTGNDEGHIYYLLQWDDGLGSRVYCSSETTCDGSYGSHGERCQVWYKMNTYQKRSKVVQYKYTKESGWTSAADSEASITEIRYKEKSKSDTSKKKQKKVKKELLKL